MAYCCNNASFKCIYKFFKKNEDVTIKTLLE